MIAAAALFACGLPALKATVPLTLSADGLTVYDSVNNFTWLADFNLPASNRFGIPVCSGMSIDPKTCVNPSGSMSYQAATAWVAAMNAANYLGHSNWQVPTTPLIDNTGCSFTGTNGNSFGFDCAGGALGYLYNNALGLKAPNSAVSIPSYTIGPFSNFQPYYYWSGTSAAIGAQGYATFSFNSGFQDANTSPNYMYVLPMIQGKLPGTPAAAGTGLQVNPGGQTVYDPQTNVTWLANADLAATNTFGLPLCTSQGTPKPCAGKDGAMDWDSASQFIANMSSYNSGAGYLGQKNWQLPPVDPACPNYGCVGSLNPMGNLYYNQLGFAAGTPIVAAPDISVGAFHNIQPYIYWSCGGMSIQSACGTPPATSFQFSFSFGNGFLGTDILADDYYVTAYFAGEANPSSGPEITEVANAEGERPAIAPNTWMEIKGVNLAPARDSRIWQASDFVGSQMPTQLDHVSATVDGVSAFVYYISPTQINILTPPTSLPTGSVKVVVTNNVAASASFTVEAQTISPSFFVFGGGAYVAALHSADYSLVGAPSLSVPGYTFTPAKPGETILLYANGFGPASTPVVSGSTSQGGTLATPPVVQIGGVAAKVQFAGLVSPGEFQFNVVIPASLANGDQPITATYGGASTQPGTLITIHN